MIIKKKVTNSHVLLNDLNEHFNGYFGFGNNGEELCFIELPEGVTELEVREFVETWENSKTDDELIKEEETKKEREKMLLLIDDAMEQNAIKASVKAEITDIKQKAQNVYKDK